MRYAKGLPPEEKDTTSAASADDDLKARDVFSLGVLIDEVLAGNLAIATLTRPTISEKALSESFPF